MNISLRPFTNAVTHALLPLACLSLSIAACSRDRATASAPESVILAGRPAAISNAGSSAGASAGGSGLGAAGIAAVGGSGGIEMTGIAGASAGSSAVAGTGGSAGPGGASGGGGAGNGGAGGFSGVAGSGGVVGSAGASGNASVPSGVGAVGQHGALHVHGNRVVDAMGQPLQLRGMSLFWSQWSDYYYSAGAIDQLADDWHATLVRAALGVENDGGYLMTAAANEAKVVAVADHATERGVYVLIDWHDGHAQTHQSAAIDFFTRMAKKYGNTPAVIFEIYNEPQDVDWPTVKTYAQAVIAAIRGAGATNLIIVGTPNWSQDVDVAAANPITGQNDIAYTLHFYAATHKQPLRDKAQKALDAGLALFVTEWGTCEANGDGALDQTETTTWLGFLAQNHISWANWSLNNKAESCSALTPSAGTTGPWTGSALTQSGALIKPLIP